MGPTQLIESTRNPKPLHHHQPQQSSINLKHLDSGRSIFQPPRTAESSPFQPRTIEPTKRTIVDSFTATRTTPRDHKGGPTPLGTTEWFIWYIRSRARTRSFQFYGPFALNGVRPYCVPRMTNSRRLVRPDCFFLLLFISFFFFHLSGGECEDRVCSDPISTPSGHVKTRKKCDVRTDIDPSKKLWVRIFWVNWSFLLIFCANLIGFLKKFSLNVGCILCIFVKWLNSYVAGSLI